MVAAICDKNALSPPILTCCLLLCVSHENSLQDSFLHGNSVTPFEVPVTDGFVDLQQEVDDQQKAEDKQDADYQQ